MHTHRQMTPTEMDQSAAAEEPFDKPYTLHSSPAETCSWQKRRGRHKLFAALWIIDWLWSVRRSPRLFFSSFHVVYFITAMRRLINFERDALKERERKNGRVNPSHKGR